MTALDRLREKKRSHEKLTDLEDVVLDAHYTQDPKAEGAANELEAYKQIKAWAAQVLHNPSQANWKKLKAAFTEFYNLEQR